MKFLPGDNKNGAATFRLAASLLVAALIPILLFAGVPPWWAQRGVIVDNAAADDYGPVNQGQLKNIATAAIAEMDAKLDGGSGDELHGLAQKWSLPDSETNDFAPVNLGQLKNIARPFYDRLKTAGLVDNYPWDTSASSADDFAVANIGQVKQLFSFEIPAANSLQNAFGDRLSAGQNSGNLALQAHAVWIWDDHFSSGAASERNYPRRLAGLSNVASVSAGERHVVVLGTDGRVWSWGENAAGQLGDGTNLNRYFAAPVPNLANVVSVKAGGLHTVALQRDGTVLAWGDNYYGQLGNGNTNASANPVAVVGLENVRRLAAGSQRSAALTADGSVWTWGYDHYSPQTGQEIYNTSPAVVADLTDVVDIAVGTEHVVAVKSDGSVWAWGSNYANQLGNGNPWWMFQAVPALVPTLTNIVKVASSYEHTLALTVDGTVWSWGYNSAGQLGDGTSQPRQTPVRVVGLTDVIAIATTYNYSLAMKADGTVWAWGDMAVGTLPGADLHVPQQVGLGIYDNNHNGMDDRWEIEFFGDLNQLPNADFDGDGISNLQEYLRGSDPRDYYNGETPVLEIVSGNNQVGNPGTVLSRPFTVRVRSATGRPFLNAPVTFAISGGAGGLARSPADAKVEKLVLRTDANGQAAAYHELPAAPGTSTRTTVSAGDAADPLSVLFRGVVKFSLPPPAPPPPDSSPSPSPSATASPTATPAAPYRYAIVDLGKDLYPIRINNQGWILVQGSDASGNWGNFRWKGGVLERLTYSGPNTETVVTDINDAGMVVGYFKNGAWRNNQENEIEGGLQWAPDKTTAVKYSARSAFRSFEPQKPGSLRQASLNVITNANIVFGDACTGTVRGFLFDTIHVMNSHRWAPDLPLPEPLSNASAVNNPPTSGISNWQGVSDTITRANSAGRYIGRTFTPFATMAGFLQGTESGMIDGEAVSFDPVDINESGIVVGNNTQGGSMIIRTPKPTPTPPAPSPSPSFTETTLEGSSPLCINNHTRPAPTSSATPSPSPTSDASPTPIPTPTPAPQILAWVGDALAIWERQEDGETWHPSGLEEMIPAMDGWDFIEPYEMNDSGMIIGAGWYTDPSNPKAQSEQHAFLLVPVGLMVDGNRDGEMSFDDAGARDADTTSKEKPYRFWINDDDDGAAGDPGEHIPITAPDYADGLIRSSRDLEDFARLHSNVAGLGEALASGTIKAAFEWLHSSGGPKLKLYRAVSGGSEYLTNPQVGLSATLTPFKETLGEVTEGVPLFIPQDFWLSRSQYANVPATLPVAWFLFEGGNEGKGELALTFWKEDRKIAQTPGVWLDLKNIKTMYQRCSSTPETLTPPYVSYAGSLGANSPSFIRDEDPIFERPPDETEQCLIFVHGWKATTADAISASEIMYKRLWWEGYKGRFAAFRWPTKTSATSYNTSEWLAWKFGKSLADFVNMSLRPEIPTYTISIAAHSMGNVVTGSALKRGMTLQRYLLMEAAVPSGCYNDTVNNYVRFTTAEESAATPDTPTEMGYRSFLQSTMSNVAKFVSFFNIDDYALATGSLSLLGWPFQTNWEKNQVDFKPDSLGFGRYGWSGTASYFSMPKGDVRTVTDVHESLSFVARPRSKAAGAEIHNATVFGSVFNLETACAFGAGVDDHSGQFTRPIQELKPFYKRMADELKQ
jgi:hypothetical protein